MKPGTDLLEQFATYWRKRVADGKSSPFDRMEWMALQIFAEWLDKRLPTAKTEDAHAKAN
jgi:hypothetical protein